MRQFSEESSVYNNIIIEFKQDAKLIEETQKLLNEFVDCKLEVKMAKDVYLRFKKELEQRDLKVKAAQEAEEKRKEEEYKNS